MPFFARMHFLRCALLSLLASLVLVPLAPAATKAKPTRPGSEPLPDAQAYKGAIVIDAATGKTLFEDRADTVSPPASMTKLMTFAVLYDRLSQGQIALNTPVTVTAADSKIGGTQVYLKEKEVFPVEELIYAMMIQSANDAAYALAHTVAGSVPAFVELMNAKARELGMTQTRFVSPHGLPPSSRKIADSDLTTPRDFATLCRYLLAKTDVLKYTSVAVREFGTGVRATPQRMENHNKLLGKVAGVDGLKTGYTAGAGYCLSATAQRNGRRVILVIMDAMGPGGKADLGHARDLKAVELLERGFAALPPQAAAPTPAPAQATATTPAGNPAATPAPANSGIAPAPPPPVNKDPNAPTDPVIKFSIPKK